MITRLLLIASLAVGVPVALAQPATDGWPRKKLIETGWDQPDTARFRQNLAEMDQTPFDGVVVVCNGKTAEDKGIGLRGAFCPEPWQQDWFRNCLEDLQATKPTRLKDNFVAIGANPGNVDWFDDAGWKNVVEHWRIAAWLAKQGGMKGLLFDPEPYTKDFSQFKYAMQADNARHTFAEYYAKARERGRQVMEAIGAEYPEMTVFCYFMNSVNGPAAGQPDAVQALAGSGYGLYAPFIDGWLDAIPPTMTLVDGCEGAYMFNSRMQYVEAALKIKGACQSLVSPENRAKYRAQTQVSYGVYLDAYVNPEGNTYYIGPKNGSRLNQLRENVTNALEAADEYVWVYGEKYRWWPTPNGGVKPEYWDQMMPGMDLALRFAADPAGMARQLVAQGNLPNLARNPDFGSDQAKAANGSDLVYKAGGFPVGWGFWQENTAGTAGWDRAVGHAAPGSGRASQVTGGCFTQEIGPVQPGERYTVQAWARVQGQGNAAIRLRWQTAEGRWIHEQRDKLVYGAGVRGEWQELLGVAEVPEDVGKLVILLGMGGQPAAEDVVWFDDVTCLKLP
jgi:hypothetical protein